MTRRAFWLHLGGILKCREIVCVLPVSQKTNHMLWRSSSISIILPVDTEGSLCIVKAYVGNIAQFCTFKEKHTDFNPV